MNHVDVNLELAARERENEALFARLQHHLGVKRPHRLTLMSMWQWMALLTADGYELVPVGNGLYDRRDIRLPAKA